MTAILIKGNQITEIEQRVYEIFLSKLADAIATIPEWREKEIDLAHAWLHSEISRLKGRSPRYYNSGVIMNEEGKRFHFGRPLHSEQPAYEVGSIEQLKRDNFFFQRFNKEKKVV